MFQPNLQIGEIINNEKLVEIFTVNKQQGMRKSITNNCLVLVSNSAKGLYDNKWEGKVLHYTGMGYGNQSFTFMQNKTVFESNSNGVTLFLFEVLKPKNYIYRGEVELADTPYMTSQVQKGVGGRQVCIFPLRLKVSDSTAAIDLNVLAERKRILTKKAKREKLSTIEENAKLVSGQPSYRLTYSKTYERNIYVKEYVLRLADGVCQLCNTIAPFEDKDGKPYLEVHHIEWLSRSGNDTIDNAIALCPNCHRKMHINDDKDDFDILKNKALLQSKK
ncbi:HNH endonuclease [Carnobacterium sp.]|uniref:HNH endonuclease n=1 Tax=Carnobacterium sp. TaxID=48221 RepID=UPI00388FFCA7